MSFEHKEFELYSTKQPEIEFLHLNSYYDDCYINLYNSYNDLIEERFPTTKENESDDFLYKDDIFQNMFLNEDKINESNISLKENEEIFKNLRNEEENHKIEYKIFHKGSEQFFQLLKETKKKIKKPIFFKVCEEKINPYYIKIEFRNNDSVIIKNKIIKKKKKKANNIKIKRKFKPDNIRKKIKARFHKSLKNAINSKLIAAGSKKLFDFFPQSFVSNIAIKFNREAMSLTYRQILEKNFSKDYKNKGVYKKKPSKLKFEKNLRVLNYLDHNPQILENSGFDVIGEMKYSEILKEYFVSAEFEESIKQLKDEKEDEDYIKEYIIKAKTYINFFMKISSDNCDFESENISDKCEIYC